MTTESAVQLPAGQRQLFLDDAWVAKVENLRKAMHQPVKKGAVIRPDLALGIGGHQTRRVPHWDAEAYDLPQIIGPAGPLLRGAALWFYYTGLKYCQRPENPEPDASAVCLAGLRRDGFISLDAGEAEGSVVTRVLVLPKGDLYVNVDATGGSAMVRVCDEHGEPMAGFEASESISGDQPRAKVQFAAGNLAVVNGRPVSLRFTLRHASLYSYWVAT